MNPDPRSSATAADLEEQLAFATAVREMMTRITAMVSQIRGLRDQIEDRNARLASDREASELVAEGIELVNGLTAVEEVVHNPHAEVDYDVLAGRHGGAQLYSRLSWLFHTASGHDGPPTQGMKEVRLELAQLLAAREAALDTLIAENLDQLNAMAKEREMPFIMTPERNVDQPGQESTRP